MYIPGHTGAHLVPGQEESLKIGGLSPELAAVVLIVSLLIFAVVNAVEISMVSISRIRVRHLAEQDVGGAKAIERIQSRQELFFSFVVLLQSLSVIVTSSMGSFLALELVGGVTGFLAGTVVMTVGLALFGEVTPKVLGAHAPEQFPLFMARPVEALLLLLRPVVIPLAAAPSYASRLIFGERSDVSRTVSEAELRMLIDIGAEEGSVAEAEAELLERVFQFGDRRVNEIMVPRTEVVWLERGAVISDFYRTFEESPHTRFPVFENTQDNVVGIINIKDVLRGIAEGQFTADSLVDLAMRPAMFVPETKFVGALFFEMQQSGHQMAIVVDEYGGTAGLATLEMLLEELVGYVSDELRRHEDEFITVDERTFQIDAGMSITDANEELELELPEGDYETVAGFVLSHLGHIPYEGEQFTYNGLRIAVTKVLGRKVEEVTVTRL